MSVFEDREACMVFKLFEGDSIEEINIRVPIVIMPYIFSLRAQRRINFKYYFILQHP